MGKSRRSSLGGHWAGTGMAGPTSQQFDNHKIVRSNKSWRPIQLSTNEFDNSKEGKAAFKKYCEEQSGEVVIYNINDKDDENGKE